MISLFEYYPEESTGVVFPPNWNFIKSGYLANVEKVKEYYKLNPIILNSSHFLIRLLESIAVPMDVSLANYYDSVDAKAGRIAMAFGITSPISKGTVFEGIFYGKGSTELLVLDDTTIDANDADTNWTNVSAIIPLLHPKSDMDILLPTGIAYSKEIGLSIFSINISLLAIQYRAFLNAQDPANPNPITTFIACYVLPNMLSKQTEIAFFNRFYNSVYNIKDGRDLTHQHHKFVLPNYTTYLDVALPVIKKSIESGVKRFETVLKTIPAFDTINVYQALIMPDIAPTMQVDWLLTIARLKVINLLITLTGDQAYSKNNVCLIQVMRTFHINSVSSMIIAMLPNSVVEELKVYHSRIKQIIESDNITL